MQLSPKRLLTSVCCAAVSTANSSSSRRSLLERPHFHHSQHFRAYLCNERVTDGRTWGVGALSSVRGVHKNATSFALSGSVGVASTNTEALVFPQISHLQYSAFCLNHSAPLNSN